MKTQDTNFNPKMSSEGQLSDNELIAEFMGLPLTKKTRSFVGGTEMVVPFMNWKYHTSWDWLMPVYRKFKDVLIDYNKKLPTNSACQGNLIEVDIHCAVSEVDIDKAHFYIVRGIKWHNKTQTP